MRKDTVSLQVELPSEFVELLAERGDEILKALELAIAEARRVAESGLIQERRVRIKQRSNERRDRINRLGRFAYRLMRRKLRSMPGGLAKLDREQFKNNSLSAVALELHEDTEIIRIALSRHRTDLNARIRDRRYLSVLRRVLVGHSNLDIADAVKIHINTVVSYNKRARTQAAERSISLSQLERNLTALRTDWLREEADRRNVVDWRTVQKVLERGQI